MKRLTDILLSYEYAMRAYEDLARYATDEADQRLKNHIEKSISSSFVDEDIELSDDDARQLVEFSQRAMAAMQDRIGEMYESRHLDLFPADLTLMPQALAEEFDALPPTVRATFNRLLDSTAGAKSATRHSVLLFQSVLIGVITEFEVLVATMIDAFFEVHPSALKSDATLTTKQLAEFASLDDAWTFLREREVAAVLRDGLANWIRFFKTRLKIDLRRLTADPGEFAEFFQRRHLFVHRRGRISADYIAKVPLELRQRLSVHTNSRASIGITPEYAGQAIAEIEYVGCTLALSSWRKMQPDQSREVIEVFHDTLERALQERRWSFALRLGMWGLTIDDGTLDHVHSLLGAALARKHLGSLDAALRVSLRRMATAANDVGVELRVCAILSDADSFFERIDANRGANITEYELTADPFYRELRGDSRYRGCWTWISK